MARPHPGTLEIEWLGDLKALAEEIGAEVLGEPIDWRVETGGTSSGNRPDVVVERRSSRTPFLTGEAKRPDAPEGAHPLVQSEVDDAVKKAQDKGVGLCFTTNFHQIGLFDAGAAVSDPVQRLHGSLIDFIPEKLAKAPNWWRDLSDSERRAAAEPGLRALFEAVLSLDQGLAVPKQIDSIVISFLTRMTDSLLEPLTQSFLSGSAATDPAIREQSLHAGLNLNENQQCRYFVAQGIVEVISATLFYEVLRGYFGANIGPLLGGTSPSTSTALSTALTSALSDAEAASGDYEPILRLSPGGRWVIANAPPPAIRHWLALFDFIERLDVSSIEGDVLGTIFERLIAPERRHELGQHYTQPRLARSMAKWGVLKPDAHVLDPACGAGTFLVETKEQHVALGATHDDSLRQTFGNDLDPFATHLAAINLAATRIRKGAAHPIVHQGDAFDLRGGSELLSVHTAGGQHVKRELDRVDLVITNPPFAQKHPDEDKASQDLFSLYGAHDAADLPRMKGANLAAWFVLLAAGLPPKYSRMAFVLPVALWQNDNLRAWRAWVRERYNLTVWHTEEDIWFSDARVAVCVVLFEPISNPSPNASGTLDFVEINEPVSGELVKLSGVPSPSNKARVRSLGTLELTGDAVVAGTKPDALLTFERAPNVSQFEKLKDCGVASGQKLGHAFFKLTDLDPGKPGVIRTVEGLKTTARIPAKFLTPLLSSPKELSTGVVQAQDLYLLTLPKAKPTASGVKRYLQVGEAAGVHLAPSVAARGKAWWHIQPDDGDLAIPTHSQFTNEVAWFDQRGVANNNFHMARLKSREDAEIVAACLASAFGALNRLYVSCEIGCEGARHMLLPQVKSWFVLDPQKISTADRAAILAAYRSFRVLPPAEIDHMPADAETKWSELTRTVSAAAHGGSTTATDALADSAIAEAHACVVRRRRRETLALRGRTRAPGQIGESLDSRIRRWLDLNPSFARSLELLAAGADIVTLRGGEEGGQASIFNPGGSMLELYVEDEERLSKLLGGGFRCAPPHPEDAEAEFDELIETLSALLEASVAEFAGQPPTPTGSKPTDDAATETWEEISAEIRAAVVRHLRAAVRADLG